MKIVSPVDGSIVAERSYATDREVEDALRGARDAAREWRHVGVASRATLCRAIVDAMLAQREEIVPELAWQMGRPIRFGAGELGGFEERAHHMIEIAEASLAEVHTEVRPGFERFIRRDPLGVVLVVAPWNYPFLTAVNSVIPAVMAGNVVLLKHASQTLLVGERFQAAFEAAGAPTGVFQNLVLSHEQTARLLSTGSVDRVNFTGSVEAGRSIERSLAGTFAGCGLELGGKDPAYVLEDADLPHAVENLVDGAFFNSGQSCCGIERIYVASGIYDAFVEQAVELTRTYVLGDPLNPETTLGPMVKTQAADFVRDQIREASAAGARSLVDPAEFAASQPGTPYLAPQILVDVDHSMRLMREESFGPVVGIMPVDSDDDAIRLMNDSPYGLSASFWSRDLDRVRRLGTQVETGTVFMNRADYLDPALAWTGVKDTGRGATLSALGYEQLTRPKSFHLRYEI